MTTSAPNVFNSNFTHMYDFVDYRCSGNNTLRREKPRGVYMRYGGEKMNESPSIYQYISDNFKDFARIVDKANMKLYLDNLDDKLTLFIPTTVKFSEDLDSQSARMFVTNFLFQNIYSKAFLQSSEEMYIVSKRRERLYISNKNDDTFIFFGKEKQRIVNFNVMCANGIIHVVE